MEPLVSVIVPVYNADKYLGRCLNSIVAQTYPNIEIIVVNDGSTDSSKSIIEDYAERYKFVKLITKSNGGVTDARLVGLEAAKGIYISFVDADDWIESDFITTMILHLGESDVVCAGIYRENEHGKYIGQEKNIFQAGVYETQEERIEIYQGMINKGCPFQFGITPYLCNKIYKKDKIMPIIASVDKRVFRGEDVIVNCRYLLDACSITLIDDCKYHYVDHLESAVHRIDEMDYINAVWLYESLYKVFECTEYSQSLIAQLDDYMRFMIWNKIPEKMALYNHIYFPFRNIMKDEKIVLYGAGKAGKVFYDQIIKTGYCKLLAWVDSRIEGVLFSHKIEKPNLITSLDYDKIVVAVYDDDAVNEIIKYLSALGVKEENIITVN